MDATDTGYGFSMNGIQPIGTITTGNRYFVKLNKSMNENNTRFNTYIVAKNLPVHFPTV